MSPTATMKSELLSRRAICTGCRHLLADAALMKARGDRHVHYCALGEAIYVRVNLNAAFLSGPESNCPIRAWGNPGTGTAHATQMRTDTEAPTTVARVAQPPPAVDAVDLKLASVCIFAEAECAGCKARPKLRCAKHGVVLNVSQCADPGCSDRLPLSELRIGAVITAWNEGDEVRQTIESLRAGVREAKATICLVDDGSMDKSCMTLLRNETPQGVGRSRNRGWQAARDADVHVVSFHDAHMRFNPDECGPGQGGSERVLERAAVKAMQNRAVISCGSRDIPGGGVMVGCWMHYDPRYGLQPKWQHADRYQVGPAPWKRMPCMMGAGYVMSVETALALEAPTGQLWEDTAGRWGLSEQALSIKAYLLGIPILVNQDLVIAHRYRKNNPTPDAGRAAWKNMARMAAVLFGPQVYEERFAAWCAANVPPSELAPILADAFPKNPAAGRWPVDPATVWTHLLGEGAPITSPHPDHAWLPEVEKACREIAARNPDGRGARVFIWRPGEAMVLVRRLLPEAEISAVEIPGHRLETWEPICKRLKVKLSAGNLARDYAVPPVKECDLILVSGEMQAACTAAAKLSLATAGPSGASGRLLVNASANRRQLERGERDKEAELLAAAPAGPTTGLPPVISPVGAAAHSDQDFEPVLRAWAATLRGGSARILEWGPGLSTQVLHEACPDAVIISIEHQQPFAERARAACPWARIVHEPLRDYGPSDYGVWPLLHDEGGFDLVFVDGRRRSECLVTATAVLKSGGVVILHDAFRPHYRLAIERLYDILESNEACRTRVLRPKGGAA